MQRFHFGSKTRSFSRLIALTLLTQSFELIADSTQAENFNLLIEKKCWKEAENWISQHSNQPAKTVAICALQLAHAYGKAGQIDSAFEILDTYWKTFEESKMTPYGWMLKARLSLSSNSSLAWKFFENARAQLPLDQWPSEDSNTYLQLKAEKDKAFDHQLQSLERLIDGGLQLEALTAIDKILSMIKNDFSSDFSQGSQNAKSLERHLILMKAQILQEMKRSQEALDTLEHWPAGQNAAMKNVFLGQDLTRSYIRGLCLIDLGNLEAALSELQFALESGRQQGANPLVTLRIALALSQALHQNHQTSQALALLNSSQELIYSCSASDQNLAHFAWTKQSVHLLIEVGDLYQALEQLDYQLKLRHTPKSRAGLLLLKASLLELMNNTEGALALNLELLSNPLSPSELETCAQKLLSGVDTATPTTGITKLQHGLCKLVLSTERPPLSAKTRLEISDWLLRQGLAKPEELRGALTLWLKDLELGPWKAPSLYILGQIQTSSLEKELYFQKVLDTKNAHASLKTLSKARLERLSAKPAYSKIQNLLEMATQSQGKIREMVLACALDLAIEHRCFQLDIAPFAEKTDPASAVGILYQQWRLEQPLSSKDRLAAMESLRKGINRNDIWGLRASCALSRFLAKAGQGEKAAQLLESWAQREALHESLQRSAWMQLADFYYHQSNMPLARKYISQVLEKWPEFEERPWLQLRQFSEQEYLLAIPESLACLKDLQERYPQHPVRLTAAFIQARSVQAINGPGVQSLKAWEDVLIAARTVQKQQGLSADAQATYVRSLIEKARCLCHIGMQRQAITSLKSAMHASGDSQISLEGELSHELQLEIAQIHELLTETEMAKALFLSIWQDSIPSKWQTTAALELSQIELTSGNYENCLDILQKLTCYNELEIQKRLLLAARASQNLGQTQERQNYLHELLTRDVSTPVQQEALWYVYLWNQNNPQIAERALRKLSQSNHPLAKQAKEVLVGNSSLSTPSSNKHQQAGL